MGRYSNKSRTLQSSLHPATEHESDAPSEPSHQQVQAQRRLTASEAVALVAAYAAGARVYELARQWGVHRETVRQHLDRAKVARRPVGLSLEMMPELTRLYESGWSIAAIGRKYAVAGSTVRRHLLAAGVRIRRPSDHS